MSMLAALARAYDRMAEKGEVPPFGYSMEKIGFVISLNEDGTPACMPIDLRDGSGKKKIAPLMLVPERFKRSGTTPRPLFLWDNAGFVLGVTSKKDEEEECKKAHAKFLAFRDKHLSVLSESTDAGLSAFYRFISEWTPEDFECLGWPDDMRNENIVFALERERLKRNIHDRPAARDLWRQIYENWKRIPGKTTSEAICLVTGEHATIARTHPPIKGIRSSSSKDADSIVSFNREAFTSYGHKQGKNAPVSEAAAFAYTAALNHFLARGSPHRIQIGDASTVFWAEASDAEAAAVSEGLFANLMGGAKLDQQQQAAKVGAILKKIAAGRPVHELRPDLPKGVRFHVLGLSPNAARLSVRFWLEDDFAQIGENSLRHFEDMRLLPPPNETVPSIWRCLIETATQRKSENIPPQLAGDMLRAVLTGGRYPQTLLATLLMRLRADKDVNGLRAALLKAVISRSRRLSDHPRKEDVPVSLDPENTDPGYLLGRLFAAYEYAQSAAFGSKVNATIRDQFYGTASATPRAVFPILQRKAMHHLSRLRKDKPGLATNLDRKIGEIFEVTDADSLFVPTLSMERQALFAIGYYHQRNAFYTARSTDTGDTHEETEE